ncbi:hypothetical protein B9479_004950 [Cryptococcus floricola]|uniref:Uncharacterized protein n=1 Tax=Cryptococcus floricola TaxID=2591691 RepID=A0A5D3AWG5_9TREE|nr:hypothetical protein B9479_004950 [Cryptococcus floricola]
MVSPMPKTEREALPLDHRHHRGRNPLSIQSWEPAGSHHELAFVPYARVVLKDGQLVFVSGPVEKRVDGDYVITLQSMHHFDSFSSSSASSSSPHMVSPVRRRPAVAFLGEPPAESSKSSKQF